MRDLRSKRRVARGSLRIDVYPLMIVGCVGKVIDHFLGNREPVADGHFFSFIASQFSHGPEFEFSHAITLFGRLWTIVSMLVDESRHNGFGRPCQQERIAGHRDKPRTL
jgi:hypothetical protein